MRLIRVLVLTAMLASAFPVTAQDGGCALPPRLVVGRHGYVTPGAPVNARSTPGLNGEITGQLEADTIFEITDGPQCVDGYNWWQVNGGNVWGMWIAEGINGAYFVDPYEYVPPAPVSVDVLVVPPVMLPRDVPLPAVTPASGVPGFGGGFATWNWDDILDRGWYEAPDPVALQLPPVYAGDFPVPPVNLSTVRYVTEANLNPAQLTLLAQNGFVVVPGGRAQFDSVYNDGSWPQEEGKGDFITTDALLHALFITYQNALMFLEQEVFYGQLVNFVGGGYEAAVAQWQEAAGTPLEAPARRAAIFYAVPLMLLADAEGEYVDFMGDPLYGPEDRMPSAYLMGMDSAILTEAQPVVEMIRAAQGRLPLPILEDLEEDFSQYKVRGYYEGKPLLESYFRAMMWLGRITFKARDETDTLTGLLTMRALFNSGRFNDWQGMAETITFLIGPMDDLSPLEYGPLAAQVFGEDLSLAALSDPARLDTFLDGVARLPGPRVNSIPLPVGMTAEQVDEYTRGFRLFGQRFTLDGYIMQQLIFPEVGTMDHSRALPLGLDIAAVLGSDVAFLLAEEAGATAYEGYTEHVTALRREVSSLYADVWMENAYGGWLWALQPLLVRDPALVPPMMQTDAWLRKDIMTTLGSWTELKHATLLYAEQPYGGLGGGGMLPPVTSWSIVEPNPEVFQRIAIVAATLNQGIRARGFLEGQSYGPLDGIDNATISLAIIAAKLAEMARKEIAGEALTYDDLYYLQENFGMALWDIRYMIEQWIPEPEETVALVADVASNPAAGVVLEEAIGEVDFIYVVSNSPHGYHLARGAVYSQYEFIQPIDERLTDDEWQAMVAAGNLPPRHSWTSLYFSE